MHIDLRTVTIEPLRQTYSHLERRFGNKPASRYQEGTYDLQAWENLHYRPTWDPEQTLYDPSLSRIRMKDWYALKDPRQFYYHTYTLTRARQQETAEANFSFVEGHGLAARMPEELREMTLRLLIPLRHAAWGANLNNMLACSYGFGTAFTQPCIMQAMDNLGIAQYLSRLGLLLGGEEALDAGKQAWVHDGAWQGLRRYVEDSLVIRDPIEAFLAQNASLDGLLYPLVYEGIVDDLISARGGAAVALLTQFMSEWSEETRRWIDAVLRTAGEESSANREVLEEWLGIWSARAAEALQPVIALAAGERAGAMVAEVQDVFANRMKKAGLRLAGGTQS